MARPVTKYAKVSKKQRDQLRDLLRTHRLQSHRRRAHAILLSDQEYPPAEIAEILEAHPESVRSWIDQFNEAGIDGLEDRPRCGGTPMLNDDQQQSLRDLIETFPNQPRKVISELASETGVSISRATLRRYCHRFGLRWKRFRKSLKHRRDEKAFRRAKREITRLVEDPKCHVVYFDEAALTLRGVVPYGWQPEGQRLPVPVSGGSYPSLQTLGFQLEDDTVDCYFHSGKVVTQTVIDAIDDFSQRTKGRTVLVLDNASVHTSGKFASQLPKWESRGLTVLRLPSYSPELNPIEHFWKKLKYQWMPRDAWDDFASMLECATACVAQVGKAIIMPSLRAKLS